MGKPRVAKPWVCFLRTRKDLTTAELPKGVPVHKVRDSKEILSMKTLTALIAVLALAWASPAVADDDFCP